MTDMLDMMLESAVILINGRLAQSKLEVGIEYDEMMSEVRVIFADKL